MRDDVCKHVREMMMGAFRLSKGTMPMEVCFYSQDAVDYALKWKKRKKATNLTPILLPGPLPAGVIAPEYEDDELGFL